MVLSVTVLGARLTVARVIALQHVFTL